MQAVCGREEEMRLLSQAMWTVCDIEEEGQSLNWRTGLENCVYSIIR